MFSYSNSSFFSRRSKFKAVQSSHQFWDVILRMVQGFGGYVADAVPECLGAIKYGDVAPKMSVPKVGLEGFAGCGCSTGVQ